MPATRSCQNLFAVTLVCFFLSGAAGLIDQVVWSKALGLIFGHTAYAVATVLAVFMAGLAAGSAWIGGRAERLRRPIVLYAWLEFGVAASAALSLVGLAGVRALYVAGYPYVSGHAGSLLALRFAGSALVLFLPTFLMGGTLPVLVRGVTQTAAQLGSRVSRLYWINTAGAVAGTFAAGFLFLPSLGLRRTLGIAVALNLVAGSLAFLISREENFAPPSVDAPFCEEEIISRSAPPFGPSIFLLASFAVVGATAMSYEIGWTRLLSTQLGSSTYAFTLMLGTFLTGIVLGSALFEKWNRRREPSATTFAVTQTLTASAALAFLVFFSHLIEVLPPILRATHESFRGLVLAQFVTSALAMLPAAVVFGFNFPTVVVLIAGGKSESGGSTGAAVGRAYAWNTLGAIVGALAAGFWLMPRIGSFHLLAATAAVNLVVATAISWRYTPRSNWKIAALAGNLLLAVAAILIGFSNYFYDPAVASFNTLMYWNLYDRPLTLRENAHALDIVYFRDGLNANISVARTGDYVALRTNGKVDASNHDATTQLLLGHLGALAHIPRRVLIVGFGSGMTASALVGYPDLERLDIVEIEPAVVEAAPFLASLNRNVLLDPRVHVTFDDARNFLFTTRDRYDLIISEPSNPWIAGVATLFTREFYAAVHSRLTSDGLFVQWMQAYSLYPEDLKMVFATFLTEFHGATLWHGDAPDLILMAPSPPSGEIAKRAQSLYGSLRLHDHYVQLGMQDGAGLFGFYLLDDTGLRKFSDGARINSDDQTLLEYHAPLSLLVHGLEDKNREAILREQKNPLPEDFPEDTRDAALAASAETSVNQEDGEGAERFLHALDRRPATAAIQNIRGRAALAQADFRTALHAFDSALAIDPHSLEAAWGVAESNRRFGNNQKARQLFQEILVRDPQNLRALTSLTKLETDFSRWPEAEALQRRLMAATPSPDAAAEAQLGDILLHEGKLDEAYRAIMDCLAADPYSYQAHMDLGKLRVRQNNWAEVRKNLEFVMRFFPDENSEVYPLLFKADKNLGDSAAAARAVKFGLRVFPDNSELQQLKPLL
ncbi:MAG TPA: fused MFS/spermidine synthase [Candidatus Acidoferrales bacterium]|nr:fused MFS/spermidine synthase [Candidatus Acidoferrales bacterium]